MGLDVLIHRSQWLWEQLTNELLHCVQRHRANLGTGMLCRQLKGLEIPICIVVIAAGSGMSQGATSGAFKAGLAASC